MTDLVARASLAVIAGAAFSRGVIVVLGGIRSLWGRRRFERARMGWAEVGVVPEPFLIAGASVALFVTSPQPGLATALPGVLLTTAGLLLIAWTFRSWPSLHVGHGVLPDQKLLSTGAYGWVRHPVYVGGVLLWAALAVGFASLATAALTVLYVIPAYVLYARSEEAMMTEQFGDAYRRYAARVPRFLPRVSRRSGKRNEA